MSNVYTSSSEYTQLSMTVRLLPARGIGETISRHQELLSCLVLLGCYNIYYLDHSSLFHPSAFSVFVDLCSGGSQRMVRISPNQPSLKLVSSYQQPNTDAGIALAPKVSSANIF